MDDARVKADAERQRLALLQQEDARKAAEAAKKKAEDDARAKADAERQRVALLQQEDARKAAEAAKKKAEDDARKKALVEGARPRDLVTATAEIGDVLVGVQNVGFLVDRDIIRLTAASGKIEKFRLGVSNNDIFINEMRVVYDRGLPDVLTVAAHLPAGNSTNWFVVKSDRYIKEIQLIYRSRPGFKGLTRIEVWAK